MAQKEPLSFIFWGEILPSTCRSRDAQEPISVPHVTCDAHWSSTYQTVDQWEKILWLLAAVLRGPPRACIISDEIGYQFPPL